MICSMVKPPASPPRTTAISIRVSRIQGRPPQTLRFTVLRLLCADCFVTAAHSSTPLQSHEAACAYMSPSIPANTGRVGGESREQEGRLRACFSLLLVFCDDLSNCRDQFFWYLHYCERFVLKCGLILRDGFFFGLLLVVGNYPSNSIFIPAGRIFLVLFHYLPLVRLRRLLYAINGLPFNSYAVITNDTSGCGSGT